MTITDLEKSMEQQIEYVNLKQFKVNVEVEKENKTVSKLEQDALILEDRKKGEINIYMSNGENRDRIFKIVPPNKEVDFWYVDTQSAVCLFDSKTLCLYIRLLKIVSDFLKEKQNETTN